MIVALGVMVMIVMLYWMLTSTDVNQGIIEDQIMLVQDDDNKKDEGSKFYWKNEIVIDLKHCQINGLSIKDSLDLYKSLLGNPEYNNEDYWMYPTKGVSLSVDIEDNEVVMFYCWMDKEGVEEPFEGCVDQFKECKIKVVKKDGSIFKPDVAMKMADVIGEIGDPTEKEYNEENKEGALEYRIDTDERSMYLMFEFAIPEKLKGIIITY